MRMCEDMCIPQREGRHLRTISGVSPCLPPCLRLHLLLFTAVYVKLADPVPSVDSISTPIPPEEHTGIIDKHSNLSMPYKYANLDLYAYLISVLPTKLASRSLSSYRGIGSLA